jgi:hypothetical protein
MKTFIIVSVLCSAFFGCRTSQTSSEAKNNEPTPERHYDAKHCEIFIDKVFPYSGPRGIFGITFYVKTLNFRLDAPIAEVGFRGKCIGDSCSHHDWENSILSNEGTEDYWQVYFGMGFFETFSVRSYEGAFYVKTTANTYYWAKMSGDSGPGNFTFDERTFRNLRTLRPIPTPTQQQELRWLNPRQCF